MRDGFRFIDTDTHIGPNMETLREYASSTLEERWSELDPYMLPITDGGHTLSINPMPLRRQLNAKGGAEAEGKKGGSSPLKGNIKKSPQVPSEPGINNGNPEGRLRDMDKEGVDVHLIIPATFATAVSALELDLALEIYAAYHRFLEDYCSPDPSRLKATALVSGADPEGAVEEIKRRSDDPWICSVTVVLPEGVPADDPDVEPIWAALDEHDLPILHHSFFYEPPYFPGYRDIWGNVVVARAAAHPWGAQRLAGYLILSGLFDRYPRLRVGFSECSAGWVPGWLTRLQGQADYMGAMLPDLKQDPIGYAQSGHVFCGIELYEGVDMAKAIIDVVGEDVLMYQSDFPHPQCHFPDSPEVVLGWRDTLGDDTVRKIASGNAERYLRL